MNVFMKSGFEVFVDSIFSGSKWMGPDKLEKLKLDGNSYFDSKVNGELFGFDLVSTANLNDRLITTIYLVRTDRTPFAFRLTWYRPGETWKVQNFSFDTNLDDELQEAGKWKMQTWISQN